MKSLWLLVILTIALILGWNNGFDLLFRASFLLAVGLVLGHLWVRGHLRQVEASVECSAHRVQVGQGVEVRIELVNRSLIPKPWLELRLNSDLAEAPRAMVVALPGHSVRTCSFHLHCHQRGHFSLGPLVLASRDPFGLFHRELTVGSSYDLLVYPATVELSPSLLGAARATGGESPGLSLMGVSPPVRGVRDYLPGDSYSRIHWLSSARMGRLMSKELERESSQDVWLLLDMEARVHGGSGRESTEEYGVILAASLARVFLEANRAVALAAWGQQLHLVPPGRGAAQLWRVLETLSLVSARGTEPLPRLMAQMEEHYRGGSTLTIITPAAEESWFSGLSSAMRWGTRALLFMVDASTFDPGRPAPGPELRSDLVTSYRVKKGELWRLSLLAG